MPMIADELPKVWTDKPVPGAFIRHEWTDVLSLEELEFIKHPEHVRWAMILVNSAWKAANEDDEKSQRLFKALVKRLMEEPDLLAMWIMKVEYAIDQINQ